MGALTSLWIPSFVLGHILGLAFLLYALEKINGSLTRLGKLVSRLAASSRGRTKDAPSPSSEASAAAAAASAPATAGGKGAALAKERAASIKQTSLYADDGLNSTADGAAANGDGMDSDGGGANPAATTPRRTLLPRWNRACKCEVSFAVFFVAFYGASFPNCDRNGRDLAFVVGMEAKRRRKGSRAPPILMGGMA